MPVAIAVGERAERHLLPAEVAPHRVVGGVDESVAIVVARIVVDLGVRGGHDTRHPIRPVRR